MYEICTCTTTYYFLMDKSRESRRLVLFSARSPLELLLRELVSEGARPREDVSEAARMSSSRASDCGEVLACCISGSMISVNLEAAMVGWCVCLDCSR